MKKFNELRRSLICMTFLLLFVSGLMVLPGMIHKESKKVKNSPIVEVVEVVEDDEENSLSELLDIVAINPVNIYMLFSL